jgi:Fe2+ transport system protein FeoA
LKSLDKLKVGERAYIVDVKNSLLCEKFFEMGVMPGAMVEMTYQSELNNSIIVKINGCTYNIFKPAAETIITSAVLFEAALN